MKPADLKRWPEICESLQKQGYVGYQDSDIGIRLDLQTGKINNVSLAVADPWGNTYRCNITEYVDLSEIESPPPASLPTGYLPLDCQK